VFQHLAETHFPPSRPTLATRYNPPPSTPAPANTTTTNAAAAISGCCQLRGACALWFSEYYDAQPCH
jgi:hypothetical protein